MKRSLWCRLGLHRWYWVTVLDKSAWPQESGWTIDRCVDCGKVKRR